MRQVLQILNPVRSDQGAWRRMLQGEPHTGLWLDKYISEQREENINSRSNLVKEVASIPEPAYYTSTFERWKRTLHAYGASFANATVKGRMVVGLGNESVIETAIMLHRTYGVPYIPGSSLKGLAAAYARQRLEVSQGAYKVIFGTGDDAGYITFFDALHMPGTGPKAAASANKNTPVKRSNEQALYPDVITVHHQKYYQGAGEAPADWDSPIPIPFLSATGIYLIALAAPDIHNPEKWLALTFDILKLALAEMGIGAKTSSGYGRMELTLETRRI